MSSETSQLAAMAVLLHKTIPTAIVTRISCISDQSQLIKSLTITETAENIAKQLGLIIFVDETIAVDLSKLNCHQLFHLCMLVPLLKAHFSQSESESLRELPSLMKKVYMSVKSDAEEPNDSLMENLLTTCSSFGLDRQILQSVIGQTIDNADDNQTDLNEFVKVVEADQVLMNEVAKMKQQSVSTNLSEESFTCDAVESVLSSQLECHICKRYVTDPRSLPCLHSFCANCLIKSAYSDGIIICPKCNFSTKVAQPDFAASLSCNPPIAQLDKFHKTFKVTKDITCASCILASVQFCFNCSQLSCEIHSLPAYHCGHRQMDRQILLDKTALKRQIYQLCPVHNQEFSNFCQTCCLGVCISQECQLKHKSHGNTQDLQVTVESCVDGIKEFRRLLDEKNQLVTAKLKSLQHNQLSVAEIQQHMKESVEKYFDDITENLNQLKLKYLADLDSVTGECLQRDERAVASLTQSVENCSQVCSESEAKVQPNELTASPITELLSLRSQMSQLLRESCDGALLTDQLGISYPEGRLRSLSQSIATLTSDIKVLSIPKTWETAVVLPGLLKMAVDNSFVFGLQKSWLVPGYLARFDLKSGLNPTAFTPVLSGNNLKSFINVAAGPNGQLAVVEEPQVNLDLSTFRSHKFINVLLYRKKATSYEQFGKFTVDQLNRYDLSIVVKWESTNIFISDSTCVCEYNPADGVLQRKFNFHSLVDVADFHYDQPYDLLYVTDKTKNCLMAFDSRQHVVKTVGETGVLPGKFLLPTGVTQDRLGHLFIADTGNRRIQVFSLEGQFLKLIPFPPATRDLPTAPGEHTQLQTADHFIYFHHSNSNAVWRLRYF